VSPDGRWIAYQSDELGRFEIFVATFPAGSGKWHISSNGGTQPLWSPAGEELFYVATNGELIAVAMDTRGDALSIGQATPLFDTDLLPNDYWAYTVAPDGKRFLLNEPSEQENSAPLRLVLNWTELLNE